MGTACRLRQVTRRRYLRLTDMDMDGIIRRTEVTGAIEVVLRDHPCIRRCLCDLRGYLRNRLRHSARRVAREVVDPNERRIETGIGIRVGEENENENENEGDMEEQ